MPFQDDERRIVISQGKRLLLDTTPASRGIYHLKKGKLPDLPSGDIDPTVWEKKCDLVPIFERREKNTISGDCEWVMKVYYPGFENPIELRVPAGVSSTDVVESITGNCQFPALIGDKELLYEVLVATVTQSPRDVESNDLQDVDFQRTVSVGHTLLIRLLRAAMYSKKDGVLLVPQDQYTQVGRRISYQLGDRLPGVLLFQTARGVIVPTSILDSDLYIDYRISQGLVTQGLRQSGLLLEYLTNHLPIYRFIFEGYVTQLPHGERLVNRNFRQEAWEIGNAAFGIVMENEEGDS